MFDDINIPFQGISIPAYLVTPDSLNQSPAIILIHEIWGLNDNIRDIANKLKQQGYTVLAPDLLSESGILEQMSPQLHEEMWKPETKDEAQKNFRDILTPVFTPDFAKRTLTKLEACFHYLQNLENVNQKIAAVGFCFGGTYSFALAASEPRLKASVVFYGRTPEPLSKINDITCPVLAFYGEKDTQLVDRVPELNAAMAELHKPFQAVVYPNCGHAFFNDTNRQMYNKEAADDAWERMLAFLNKNLS